MTKLIPFNLERALAGDPMITRSGDKVTDFKYFSKTKSEFCICFTVSEDDSICLSKIDGKFLIDGNESGYDLFMAPKTTTYWVNVYKSHNGVALGFAETTLEACENQIANGQEYIKTINFEIED